MGEGPVAGAIPSWSSALADSDSFSFATGGCAESKRHQRFCSARYMHRKLARQQRSTSFSHQRFNEPRKLPPIKLAVVPFDLVIVAFCGASREVITDRGTADMDGPVMRESISSPTLAASSDGGILQSASN